MKRYAMYKNSGIEWIGEIPIEWAIAKVSFVSNVQSGGTPSREKLEYWENGTINWMSSGEVNDEFIVDTKEKITELGMLNSNAKILPINTVMMALNGQGKTKGMTAILEVETTCNQSLAAFICNELKLHYKYLFYCFKSMYKYLRGVIGDDAREGLSVSFLKSQRAILPPLQTQQSIADYLDRKTVGISALIADKRKMIDLLREKRQATIREAVTKGLDKTAKMKGSGIEWIGEIPEDWKVIAVSKLSNIVRGASPRPAGDPLYFNGNDIPWITVAEVTKGEELYLYETESFLTFAGKEKSRFVEAGTLLLSNSGATLGVPKISMISGCINDGSVALTNLSVNQLFLLYVFKSLTTELRKQMQGYGQPNLNTTIIKNIIIPHPMLEEQQAIADYIYNKTVQIDSLISDITEQIDKLKEYSQSIISEAVTGKVAV